VSAVQPDGKTTRWTSQKQSDLNTRMSVGGLNLGSSVTWIIRAAGAAILELTLLPMTTSAGSLPVWSGYV